MCFGEMEPTKEVAKTSNSTTNTNSTNTMNSGTTTAGLTESMLPAWVTASGRVNYDLAKQILDSGYKPYDGTRVAPLSADEQTAGGMVRTAAGAPNPYKTEAENLLRTSGSTPGFNYGFNTIVDESGPLGQFSAYMNPYLQQVLDPVLREIGIMGQKQRNDIGASATMSGAFGDSRHGVETSNQMDHELGAAKDATGKAYFDAYTQAMAQRQADASRLFGTQQAQAGEDRNALERMRTSGIDLTNLDKYDLSRMLGLSSALGSFGQTERDLTQKQADVDYTDFRMQEGGFDKEMLSWLSTMLAAVPTNKAVSTAGVNTGQSTNTGSVLSNTTGTGTETSSAPNNSGWQALGGIAAALL
jgi:hypothetical protein